MDRLADRLDQGADALSALSRDVPGLAVAPDAFAGDGPGLTGRVGRALHDRWAAVLEARSHEASTAAGHLADLAHRVRSAHQHYTATDETVARRFTREL